MLEEAGSISQNTDELVTFLQAQIHWILVKRRLEGGINVSAPEVSRIWQVCAHVIVRATCAGTSTSVRVRTRALRC